jgi:hypothetical protein
METKIKTYKNGHTVFEKTANGFYLVKVYIGSELHDKILCDTYRAALEYLRAFNRIAKVA